MGTSEGPRTASATLGPVPRTRPIQLALYGLLAGLVVFAVFSLVGQWSWTQRAIGGMLGLFGLVVALVCVAVEFLRLGHRRTLSWASLPRLAALGLLVFGPFAGALMSSVLPQLLHESEVAETRTRCEEVIQQLESYRRANGDYPEGIDSWRDPSARSDALDRVDYHRDGKGERYRLGFSESLANMSGFALHLYDSERGSWFHFEETFDLGFDGDQSWLQERLDRQAARMKR